MSRIRTIAIAVSAAVILAAPAAAQNSANASMSVTGKVVVPIALSVTAPLDFGSMFAGNARNISPDATGGGRFTVSGESGTAISVTLMMPTSVANAAGASIPLSNWSYMFAAASSLAGAAAVTFNPLSGTPVAATLTGGRLYFGLGATATPNSTTVAGTYSATGQITVAYVGL